MELIAVAETSLSYIECVWSPRRSARSSDVDKLRQFLGQISTQLPALASWTPVAGPRRGAVLGPEGVAELAGGQWASSLSRGFDVLVASGRSPDIVLALSVIEGDGGLGRGRLRMQFPTALDGEQMWRDLRAWSGVFRAAVTCWDPDWGALYGGELGRAQRPAGDGFVVGAETYVRAPFDFAVPAGVVVQPWGSGTLLLMPADPAGVGGVRTANATRAKIVRSGVASRIGLDVGDLLTPHEAYLVMVDYLGAYAGRSGEDFYQVLADLEPGPDGRSTDPAVWKDWMRAVARIRDGAPPRSAHDTRE